jgi:CBS domain containing-hemolysin-like protein
MLNILLVVALALITLTGLVLRKTYQSVPARELKRRAQSGNKQAKKLYRAVAYGVSLTVFLWLIIGASTTGLFFVVAREFSWPIGLIGVGVLLAVGLGISWTRVSKMGRSVTVALTPVIAWFLNYLHPLFEAIGLFFHRYASLSDHTQLYQKEDLVELLRQQEKQTDNRIEKGELDMAVHALTFGEKLVRDTLVPYSQVKLVNATDSLGPILMDELHDSGHSRFPVYDGKKSNVIGILYLHDLVQEQHGGMVKNIAHKQVTYVHEDQTLYQTLQAFLKTKRHLFIVVNQFEEMVGIITIEDVLEQIIGKPIMDEFDQYEDLRAVAARMAAQVHAKEHKDQTPQ